MSENLNREHRNYVEQCLRDEFEKSFSERLDRYLEFDLSFAGPSHHFALPILECRQMYAAGHFYGCISLIQSVAEGIIRFVLSRHPEITVDDPTDYSKVLHALHREKESPIVSHETFVEFGEIRGPHKKREDRNSFHHLLEDIELDPKRLEARAKQCMKALLKIEGDFFGHTYHEGRLVLKNQIYWNVDPEMPC